MMRTISLSSLNPVMGVLEDGLEARASLLSMLDDGEQEVMVDFEFRPLSPACISGLLDGDDPIVIHPVNALATSLAFLRHF